MEHVVPFPCGRRGGSTFHGHQVGQLAEGAAADLGDRRRQADGFNVFAAYKGKVAYGGHALVNLHFGQPGAEAECHWRYGSDGVGDVVVGNGGRDMHLAFGILRDTGVIARAYCGNIAVGVEHDLHLDGAVPKRKVHSGPYDSSLQRGRQKYRDNC